jgi:hypothetical protein
MGRGFTILLTALGLLLIALGVWVTFRFEKTPLPEAVGPVNYVIQKHPAADGAGSLVIAGALCLVGAAINSRGGRPSG